MDKRFWYVIITYIGMQISGVFGIPILYLFGVKVLGKSQEVMEIASAGYWIVISFSVALLLIWLIIRKSEKRTTIENSEPISVGHSIIWALVGLHLAFAGQFLAVGIEYLLGIEMGSENTETLVELTKRVPIVILVIAIIGPIIEEVVFRRIIFGSLYSKMNFFWAALISSMIFALFHLDFEHTLMYVAMGFAFAYVYKVTKRIWVPMAAHLAMNSIVMAVQFFGEKLS